MGLITDFIKRYKTKKCNESFFTRVAEARKGFSQAASGDFFIAFN